RHTIRLRLTAVYGGLFLACGAGLLAITYFLVSRQYTANLFITSGKAGVGVKGLTEVAPQDATGTLILSPDQVVAQARAQSSAAHELRTPLTLERAVLEVALADPNATVEKLRRACEQALAAGEQQERLIEALLTLSRSQRGLDRREPVDLAAIAADAAGLVEHDGLVVEATFDQAR